MKYSLTNFSALLAAGFISGCASNPVYEGRYPWNAGWRERVVTEVGEEDEFRRKYAQRCKAEAAQSSTVRFATVRWKQMGKSRSQTVTVPQDSTLKGGDLVYVKIFDCAVHAVPRAIQQRSAAPRDKNHSDLLLAAFDKSRPTFTGACHV